MTWLTLFIRPRGPYNKNEMKRHFKFHCTTKPYKKFLPGVINLRSSLYRRVILTQIYAWIQNRTRLNPRPCIKEQNGRVGAKRRDLRVTPISHAGVKTHATASMSNSSAFG